MSLHNIGNIIIEPLSVRAAYGIQNCNIRAVAYTVKGKYFNTLCISI